jgi:hypothetical protein
VIRPELQTKLGRANPGAVSRTDPEHDRESGRLEGNEPERMRGGNMAHTRAANDFSAIRAGMEELRREREREDDAETNVRPARLWLCGANSDPIIISTGRPSSGAD